MNGFEVEKSSKKNYRMKKKNLSSKNTSPSICVSLGTLLFENGG
jgi:hypothetical protein